MEIREPGSDEKLPIIELGLTAAEALELRDALDDLLLASAGPGRHQHVSSADYQVEIAVWISEDEANPINEV